MNDLAVIPIRAPRQQPAGPVEDLRTEGRKGFRHHDAVAVLRRLIEIGELAPGERLREIAISERLGMSRTPVREAFRTLAAEGLIDLLPNRSVVVSDIDHAEIADVFRVLGALEALAGAQACDRIGDGEIRQLGLMQDELERHHAAFDRENYVNANRAIHEVVVRASRNSALIGAWRTILPRAERARNALSVNHRRWTEAVDEHRMIFNALADRDAVQVVRLIENHFSNGLAYARSGGGLGLQSRLAE